MNGTPEQWANLSRAVFDENRVPDDVVQAIRDYDDLDRERERIRTVCTGSGTRRSGSGNFHAMTASRAAARAVLTSFSRRVVSVRDPLDGP